MAEPLAGLLSPDLAEEFSAEYVKKIVEAVQTEEFLVVYHNCGDSALNIGTNGEIVLGTPGDYLCCSAPAGPAFEGAEIKMGMPAFEGAISKVWCKNGNIFVSTIGGKNAIGLCGSGLIDALAVFLETGLIDETGLIADVDEADACFRKYIGKDENGSCIYLTKNVCVTQDDIRKLQLAKASIAAGIDVLLAERHISYEEISQVVLAGGFGSFLNKKSAADIDMIPAKLLNVTCSVGNAAGEGAVSAAISMAAREELRWLQNETQYVELSTYSGFSQAYIEEMCFPESV